VKTPLLFLCHRIPYPPNKGDKIRSFHLLHHLSQYFDIYLGTFVDDPDDWPYADDVRKYCRDALFVDLKPLQAKLCSLTGLLKRQALSVPYYSNRQMQTWVDSTVEANSIKHVIAYSSPMGQYVINSDWEYSRKVVDFVDVDSDKWQQYAQQKRWPLSWLYRREARRLLDYEKTLAAEFDAGLFVSSAEAALYRQLDPKSAAKIGFYNNGVNANYFSPDESRESALPSGVPCVVFTGAMDYWPNIDAAVWFAEHVMPLLREQVPALEFYIVGSNPARAVRELAELPGVSVTGRVEDVRPYIQHAVAAVAPMRVARGVQNKVLEAMAMARPTLVTTKGLEGIDAKHGQHVLIADSPEQYVNMLAGLLNDSCVGLGHAAREFVKRHFDWDNNLPEVVLLLDHSEELILDAAHA
tara:strand:- start:44572 stop:45804 length:1233 start_codon:yes stop_codon:yes gene_type:complete